MNITYQQLNDPMVVEKITQFMRIRKKETGKAVDFRDVACEFFQSRNFTSAKDGFFLDIQKTRKVSRFAKRHFIFCND